MFETIIQLIVNGLLIGGIYALISIGLTLIFGVLEIINFAHGEFLMLSMYACYWMFQLTGIDPYVSFFFIIPIFFLLGMAVQRVVIQPIIDAPPLNQIFATVGLSMVMANTALALWKADYRTVKTSYSSLSLKIAGLMISFPRLLAFLSAFILIGALFLFLKKTYTGKAIRALAQQRKAAMLMGINVYRTYQIAFGLGIAMVGAAGAMLIPVYYAFPTVGTLFVLTAFVVVVLGGYNSLIGSLIGGLIIGIVESFSGFYLSPHLKEAVYFVIFILILLFRPAGLFGRA
ncbi:MAG: branched-chain amino acid ABC transporter permease [Deltaproteobacteria bacterium]|nr:branched-chain amino acid ABC transporter permease [Deltaproteobacteria bacterium]MBW2153622.1 branched-chain amino acid ABC transporter permease [Deltaproteobacteria bacterium]